MSAVFDTYSETLSGSGSIIANGATGATLVGWVKRASAAVDYSCFAFVGEGTTEADSSHIMLGHMSGAYGFSNIKVQNSNQNFNSALTGSGTTSAWQFQVVRFIGGANGKIDNGIAGGSIISGTFPSANAASFAATLGNIFIGDFLANHFTGKVAHVAVYDSILSDSQVLELFNGGTAGAGKNPQSVATPNLKFYAPLTSDATVSIGGITLSATGTVTYDAVDNPSVEAGGGGTPSLVVSDGTHAHAADNLALTIIGTLSIADATHAHAADSITLTATSNGTITIPAVRDWGTKALKVSETGVQVDIRNITTGALVVRKTGQATHATTGVCVVTDAAIVAGTTYEVVTRFADGSRGMWDYTAS